MDGLTDRVTWVSGYVYKSVCVDIDRYIYIYERERYNIDGWMDGLTD